MRNYIKIDKSLIPYEFDIRLNKITYTFKIDHNSRHDFFTIAIKKVSGEIYTTGEKMRLNKPLLSERGYVDFPLVVPSDATGQATRITWGNMGVTVFLYVGVQE